jgi:hypothetical protein
MQLSKRSRTDSCEVRCDECGAFFKIQVLSCSDVFTRDAWVVYLVCSDHEKDQRLVGSTTPKLETSK